MNSESLLLGILFWCSFAFSPGPFWAAWINHHTKQDSLKIYKEYMAYVLLVFPAQCFLISIVIIYIGSFNENILLPLYFIGGAYIIYYSIKSFNATIAKKEINFSLKQMTILSLCNPKIYVTIPTGALTAQYFDAQPLLNTIIFSWALLSPINILGSVFFAFIGKAAAKISLTKTKYFTSFLLLCYGVYLFYEGITKLLSH